MWYNVGMKNMSAVRKTAFLLVAFASISGVSFADGEAAPVRHLTEEHVEDRHFVAATGLVVPVHHRKFVKVCQ